MMSLLPPRTMPQHMRCARSRPGAICAPHTVDWMVLVYLCSDFGRCNGCAGIRWRNSILYNNGHDAVVIVGTNKPHIKMEGPPMNSTTNKPLANLNDKLTGHFKGGNWPQKSDKGVVPCPECELEPQPQPSCGCPEEFRSVLYSSRHDDHYGDATKFMSQLSTFGHLNKREEQLHHTISISHPPPCALLI